MPEVKWNAEVVLHRGTRLKVDHIVRTGEGHGEWDDLDERTTWTGDTVALPPDQFSYDTKVQDVVRANWNGGVPTWRTPGAVRRPKPKPGAIVIVLESPHADEYDYSNGQFKSREPLMDPNSQKLLRCHVVRLVLAAAAAKKVTLQSNADVVLCNPIQFQTSLHRLVRSDLDRKKDELRQAIRSGVWRGLWRYEIKKSFPFQDEFAARLQKLAPCLVINASTCELRKDVKKFFSGMPKLHVAEVSNHPSNWSCDTEVGPCKGEKA